MAYRLLIADDDEELVKMLKSYLEIKGFEIITAGDGLEVLEKLSKKSGSDPSGYQHAPHGRDRSLQEDKE